ncbi:MAG: DNA polymerase I [Acidobacteria bacterium]|nr:MAG: DNA polymerase I [Acidobacteriota bacterium]
MDRTELHKIKKPRLYLVDGNGYIYRAFFALPKLTNSKGLPSNALYGFTTMIRKLCTEEKPDYIGVVFDAKEKTFRHDSYDAYKEDRRPMPDDLVQQIPYTRRICEVLGLPVLEKPGFEADDVIATLMEECRKEDLVGVVVTSDKDLLQLVDGNIFTLDPMKDYFVYDRSAVEEKWGVPPDKIVELLSIMGDSIDNIPGVKGIGPKGALELIQKFGTVENLIANLDQIEKKSHRQKIEECRKDLLLSKDLVQLRKDVPLDLKIQNLKAGHAHTEEARKLFLDLEFYSIMNDFLMKIKDRNAVYDIISKEQQLKDLLQQLRSSGKFSIYCFLEPFNALRGEIIGISISTESRKASYIPLGHTSSLQNEQLSEKYVLDQLKPLLEDRQIEKIAIDLKQLILVLRKRGIDLQGAVYDPMLMSYVLNPTRHAHGLSDLAKEYLQYQMLEPKAIAGSGQKKLAPSAFDIRAMADFCGEHSDLVLEVTDLLVAALKSENEESIYETMELPLLRVLAEVEWNGVKINTAVLARLSEEMGKNVSRLESEIYELAQGEFNINSPKQIGEVLFGKLKLPIIKKTRKTKDFSTSQEVLEELAREYELPQKILEYRQFTKLKSTYVDALPQMIDPHTGRVHTNYQQTVAATGRLSSVDPNLQNIPIRTPWGRLIREAFVAEEGKHLISADYSQIELRVMAHLSQDETLIDSFLKDEDIHARTASEVFGVPMDQMTKEIRNKAKAINYGINYGQSPFGLSQLLNIDQKEAKEYIDRYFQKYPKVRAYLDETTEFAKKNGYVGTLFGRRRFLPEIWSKDRTVFMAAVRAAINTPLQGTAADIIKLAMIEVQKEIEERGLQSKMIMQVHDELVFEAPEKEKAIMAEMVKEKMENVYKMVVPLTVDLSIGKNWREAK